MRLLCAFILLLLLPGYRGVSPNFTQGLNTDSHAFDALTSLQLRRLATSQKESACQLVVALHVAFCFLAGCCNN